MKLYSKFLKRHWAKVAIEDKERLAKQTAPDGIVEINDIPYMNNDNTDHLLDVYYPEGTDAPLPVIFDIHGGGWTYGTKENNKYYNMHLAAHGFTVVNINYRLLYDFGIEHIVQDIFAALNWLEAHHEQYHCDLNNLFITGDSAGGHLAALTAALLTNKEAQAVYEVESNLKIKAGGFVCSAFALDKVFRLPIAGKMFAYLMFKSKKYKQSKYYPYCSFDKVVKGAFIPSYVVSSADDFIKFLTFDFVKYAQKMDIPHQFRFWEKQKDKKLYHIFSVTYPSSKEGKLTNKEMCDFFKNYIT
ncbi:MAG: alpha/beta hydrolase [Clostridia bacterium]